METSAIFASLNTYLELITIALHTIEMITFYVNLLKVSRKIK